MDAVDREWIKDIRDFLLRGNISEIIKPFDKNGAGIDGDDDLFFEEFYRILRAFLLGSAKEKQ